MSEEYAFPIDSPKGDKRFAHKGVTLRDYIAIKAMQGILASGNITENVLIKELAIEAYRISNAMMEARKK